jgi:hypothetical protein
VVVEVGLREVDALVERFGGGRPGALLCSRALRRGVGEIGWVAAWLLFVLWLFLMSLSAAQEVLL